MKLINKIIFSIVAFCITSSVFSQELSDKEIGLDVNRISEKLIKSGVEEQNIQQEISIRRDMYKKKYLEMIKQREEIFKGESLNKNKSTTNKSVLSNVPAQEKAALIALYNATGGNNWTNTVNGVGAWPVNDPNAEVVGWDQATNTGWYGVYLFNGHVTSVLLSNNNLASPIAFPNLSNLTSLNSLNITENHLTCSIENIQYLVNVQQLGLGLNNFPYSTIPSFLGSLTNLTYLQYESSGLSQTSDFVFISTHFPNLQTLDLVNNNYSGALPIQLQGLTNLDKLYISRNQIEDISVLGGIPGLRDVWALHNNISSIPSSLSNITDLEQLLLSNNEIHGSIPSSFQNLTKLKALLLEDNYLEGVIPNMSSMLDSQFYFFNNKFRFIDFVNQHQAYLTRVFDYRYSPQAKIDTPKTENKNIGQSLSMTMCEDNRFHTADTFQWFKNGVLINGATNRIFTINSLSTTDAGIYTCKSYHATSPNMSPLVLERLPITLNVTAGCTPVSGMITFGDCNGSTDQTCEYSCGNRTVYTNLVNTFTDVSDYTFLWTSRDPSGNVIDTSDEEGQFPFTFTTIGNNTIQLSVTDPNGCVTTFEPVTVLVSGCTSCVYTNPLTSDVKQKFIALMNYLGSLSPSTVVNGFTCPQLTALAPYITDANPKIYNFTNDNGWLKFSFSNHLPTDNQDIGGGGIRHEIVDLNLSLFNSSETHTNVGFTIVSLGQQVNYEPTTRHQIKHINFCPANIVGCTKTNPNSIVVNRLFVKVIQKLIALKTSGTTDANMNGVSFPELSELLPYVTDSNPGIYNFTSSFSSNGTLLTAISFSFSKDEKEYDVYVNGWQSGFVNANNYELDLSNYNNPDNYLELVSNIFNNISIKQLKVRHINFCPAEVTQCTKTNPRTARVKELFYKLVNHLHERAVNDDPIPDGYDCEDLDLLRHYITDKDALIYNFKKEPFSFSFHKKGKKEETYYDVLIDKWEYFNSPTVADVDVTNFSDSATFTNLDGKITLSNGSIAEKAQVRHINFCPEDICVNHVALVVDESGFIDVFEKDRIKRQLKWFLKQQADVNDLYQGNMYISIIGMSDSDDSSKWRTDNILATRITNANLNTFMKWVEGPALNGIKGYGNRYGQAGISGGSDFWKSGLETALSTITPERKLDMVIMITNGSQAENPLALKATMLRFNNRSQHPNLGPFDPSKPHLYVVGIDNGFYVYDDQNTNAGLRANQDPNYVPTLKSSPVAMTTTNSTNSTLTPALSLSLKYLFDLPYAEFPYSNLSNFNEDYFGHNDFSFIGDEINQYYLSNNVKKAGLGCRKETPKDLCEDCYSFQPIPGEDYVLTAWTKEELNVQVQKYDNPKIKLTFRDINENLIVSEPSNNITYPITFSTKGDIIEDWQRINDKFRVPAAAVFMEIELINEGNSAPVFFDDIRIYPADGSMKSFVYDPVTFRLMSELDENNYATYYEYDNEGGLVRIKKETAKGVKTIQETRSGNVIKVE